MAQPKPPSRWGTSPTGSMTGGSKPSTGRNPAPKIVGRVIASREEPRRWPWIVAPLALVVVGLVALGAALVAGVDQPPQADTALDATHTLKWDARVTETVDGLLSMDGGRPVLTVHMAAGAMEVVFRLTGRFAQQLQQRLAKTAPMNEAEIKRRYLARIYPRVEERLRMAWQIHSIEGLERGAERVPITCPSPLYVQVELGVPPVECRDPEHDKPGLRPCQRTREAWVARIISAEELK